MLQYSVYTLFHQGINRIRILHKRDFDHKHIMKRVKTALLQMCCLWGGV